MRPRPDRRENSVEDMPPGVELKLRRVVVIGGPDRTDQRNTVDHFAQMRPPVGNLDSAGAAFPEPYLHWEDRGHQLAVPGDELTHVLGGERRLQHVSVWSLGDGLAGVFVQLRLGIEGLDVA